MTTELSVALLSPSSGVLRRGERTLHRCYFRSASAKELAIRGKTDLVLNFGEGGLSSEVPRLVLSLRVYSCVPMSVLFSQTAPIYSGSYGFLLREGSGRARLLISCCSLVSLDLLHRGQLCQYESHYQRSQQWHPSCAHRHCWTVSVLDLIASRAPAGEFARHITSKHELMQALLAISLPGLL